MTRPNLQELSNATQGNSSSNSGQDGLKADSQDFHNWHKKQKKAGHSLSDSAVAQENGF